MSRFPADLLPPRILVVDDERQIHASLRLRLEKKYQLVCCLDARDALAKIENEEFDLCFADIHMPQMDGLAFIAAAQRADPALGCVVLSAFDTDENLRRTIPLQVYEFIPKPLPDRDGFEDRIPEWIERTRNRRRDQDLARHAGSIAGDLDSARLEREVELVASETARDALLQTASLLTTIHAHLVTGTSVLAARAKTDPSLTHLWRSLEEARKTADAAITVSEGFFDSAYGHRDTSPALVDSGLRHAVSIASRMGNTATTNKVVDVSPIDDQLPIRNLSGIEFLLMMVPAIAAALETARPCSTVRLAGQSVARIDQVTKQQTFRNYLWVNRRNAFASQPGMLISITTAAAPFTRSEAVGWLKGEPTSLAAISARGLVLGVQKCKGLLGLAISTQDSGFCVVIALPV